MDIQFSLEDAASKRLLKKAREFSASPRKAIQSALFVLDRKVRETFQQQKDPWGKPWTPLKPATLKRRKNSRTSILVNTAKMFRSLDRQVTDDNSGILTIGVDEEGEDFRPVTPHQFGAPEINLPKRPMMPVKSPGIVAMPREWRRDVNNELRKAVGEELE